MFLERSWGNLQKYAMINGVSISKMKGDFNVNNEQLFKVKLIVSSYNTFNVTKLLSGTFFAKTPF